MITAIIPARGGSRGVPGKNLRRVSGRSLVARAIDACRATRAIDTVYVTTDDPAVATEAEAAGAQVIIRPASLAGDTASSESALLHAYSQLVATGMTPSVIVFVQCTSPFIDWVDLDRGVELVTSGEAESVFSAVETYEFLWRADQLPLMGGQNHDPSYRPRRQDREPDYRETGAFYVMDAVGFVSAGHRFFGRTAAVSVNELTAIDIDAPHDLVLAEALAPILDGSTSVGAPTNYSTLRVDVDVLITDFDGVHTDDCAYLTQDGTESVRVSRSDGLGIERLQRAGIPVLILSKETNSVVSARAAKLEVEVLQGIEDKAVVLADWLATRRVPAHRAAYLGNDLNDLPPMGVVGWPVAVADAQPEVQHAARLVLDHPGGNGAVRELCDLILGASLS